MIVYYCQMNWEKFFKGLAIAVSGYFVVLSLLFAANASVFTFVTSSEAKAKNIAEQSGIYDDLIPVLIDELSKQEQQESEEAIKQVGEIPIEDKKVKKLISQSFDEEFTRGASESLLGGVYGWLDGRTENPQFSVNIAQPKAEFINSASNYAITRMDKLPACSFEQLQANTQEIDVFSAPCAVPGVSKQAIKTELTKQINGREDSLLAKNNIRAEDFKDQNGGSVFADLKDAPGAFQTAKWLPLFLLALAFLAGGAIVFLSENRARGIRRVGITAILSAIVIALTPVFYGLIIDNVLSSGRQSAVNQNLLHPLLTSFNEAAASIYHMFAIVLAIIGVVLIVVSVRSKDKLIKSSSKTAG